MSETNPEWPTIWVDADGAPNDVKKIIYRAAKRLGLDVVLVANRVLETPKNPRIRSVLVPHGADVADSWIHERVDAKDIVITADIPLAADIVAKGAVGIHPRGELFTEANVRERLSVRDFMHELRESGVQHGGPRPRANKDNQSFANTLDKALAQRCK